MSDRDRRQRSIRIIRDHLSAAFPGGAIEEFQPPRHGGHGFRIHDGILKIVVATDSFLEDWDAHDVRSKLQTWYLAGTIRDTGGDKVVLVNNDGLRVEPLSSFQ